MAFVTKSGKIKVLIPMASFKDISKIKYIKSMSLQTTFCIFAIVITINACNTRKQQKEKLQNSMAVTSSQSSLVSDVHTRILSDPQIEMVKQQAWVNLAKVPGTERDYTSMIKLRIADGNIIDADCKLIFPKSSWAIASVLVDDYKEVLKNTNANIFAVIYRLITDPNVLASEITINGLWRPWMGSHVHIEGRGMDIGNIRTSQGSGAIFNYNTSQAENEFAREVRKSLTSNFPLVNQYLSPWYICNPSTNCQANTGQTSLERTHRDHLHITLSQ